MFEQRTYYFGRPPGVYIRFIADDESTPIRALAAKDFSLFRGPTVLPQLAVIQQGRGFLAFR